MKQLQLIILILIPFLGWTQSEVETINGRKYFVHYVEKDQTLYSIHKQYNVSITDIEQANSSVSDGLSINEKLLIPIDINNSDYYESHVIAKGETLYGISRQFKCSVSDLKSINPELNDGIQIGQVIKVPKLSVVINSKPGDQILVDKEEDSNVSDQLEEKYLVSTTDTIVHHTVLAHETLYSIAKRYMVTPDAIRKLNQFNLTTISAGDVLIVPVKKVNYQISKNKIDTDLGFENTIDKSYDIVKKETYKIALFLPLMYTANKSYMNKPLKAGEIEKLHPVTKISADFYHGFKLAIDSLAKAGMNAELYIYDTKRDTAEIKNILDRPEFKEIDLVFGPFFPNTIDYLSKYCRANQLPMVIPFKSGNQVLYNNPFIYKTTASDMVQMDGVIDYVTNDFSKYNIVLVKPFSSDDKALFERAKNRYNSAPKTNQAYNSNIIEVDMGNSSGKELNLKLRKDTVNVIIVPSTDVKFVTSVFMRLNNVLNMNTYAKNMKIIVFGLEDWNKIDDIDLKHKIRMEQHFASYRYFDYNDANSIKFLNLYRDNYGTDPELFGVQGFDVGYYFLSALYIYGQHFDSYLPNHNVALLQNKFKFTSVSESDGKENSSICIVKYLNYSLEFVTW